MKNRSNHEIVAQILRSASVDYGGITPTRIMYKVFLSNKQMKYYVDLLHQRGLLVAVSPKRFMTTEKGLKLLKKYEEMNKFIKMFPDELNISPGKNKEASQSMIDMFDPRQNLLDSHPSK